MKLYARGALDPRWTTHHLPVVASFMLATIKVVRKLPSTESARPVYDPVTKTWSGTFDTVIDNVQARIQPYGIIGDMVDGQDTTGRRLMRVQIESKETSIHLDDQIIILSSPENPELEDYVLEVRGAIGSSNQWVTDLVCEANLKANT